MAKNVLQKKRRIAHFQNAVDSFTDGENENVLSGCLDFVSNIIQNMDSSFNSVHSSCSKGLAKTEVANINRERDSISNNCTPSTGRDCSENAKNFNKSKKKFVSQKFPLMEKSQKILKQLKHNRSIPKPRAHLANSTKSPLKVNPNKLSNSKRNSETLKEVQKLKNNNIKLYKRHVSDKSAFNSSKVNNKDSETNNLKSKKNCLKIKQCEKIKSTDRKLNKHSMKDSVDNAYVNSQRSENVNVKKDCVLKDSEGDTTDSEYERFVEENKKSLRKKGHKRQKYSAGNKACKKTTNKVSKTVRQRIMIEQCDSDTSDNISVSLQSSLKPYPSQKQKVTHEVSNTTKNINGESESDINLGDDFIVDSSEESDVEYTQASGSKNTQELGDKNLCVMLHDINVTSNTEQADTVLPDINSYVNKEIILETCPVIVDTKLSSNDSPDILYSHINCVSNEGKNESNNLSSNLLVIDLCDSDDDSKNVVPDQIPSMSLPMEEKCLITGGAQNLKCPDSDESDLEIVEVIPIQLKRNERIINEAANAYDYLKKVDNGKKCQIENCIKSSTGEHTQIEVKTEKLQNVHITNSFKTEDEHKIRNDGKLEAVYMTNICNDFNMDVPVKKNISDQNVLLSSQHSKHLDASLKDGTVLKRTITSENDTEDDIIILDSVHSSTGNGDNVSSKAKKIRTEIKNVFTDSVKGEKCSADNLKLDANCHYQYRKHSDFGLNIDKKNVKNEHSLKNRSNLEICMKYVESKTENIPIAEKELKLFEGISNSKNSKHFCNETYDGKQKFQELGQMNMTHLLELYKKEFQAYQDIIQTEANVEASLKLLEISQAEKLKYIRSLVQKYVGNNQNSINSVIEKEVLLKKEGFNVVKTLTDDKSSLFTFIDLSNDIRNPLSSNIQKQNFCISQNSSNSVFPQTVVLASKMEKDIKPDIREVDEVQLVPYDVARPKLETESSLKDDYSSRLQSKERQTLKLLKEKCNVCGKEAKAACLRCAKVFFCSHECGKKFWNDGHENECGK